MESDSLYPSLEPFETGFLPVSGGHRLYFERSGRSGGQPILFVHGGPGGGCSPWNRRFFVPDHYQIILFDQRGCGRSTPHASLDDNSTWHLVEDMEDLRSRLDIDHWLIFGGSWGSTLALLYAQRYPQRVGGLILRGVFGLTRSELDWFYDGGTAAYFPEAWELFIAGFSAHEREDLIAAYYKRLTSLDRDVQLTAALEWSRWEMATCRLHAPAAAEISLDPLFALALARIESHYFVNRGWIKEGQILADMGAIGHIPGVIVQGRYDAICPPVTAWQVHRRWPASHLEIIEGVGHSALEPAIMTRLVAAADAFRVPVPAGNDGRLR